MPPDGLELQLVKLPDRLLARALLHLNASPLGDPDVPAGRPRQSAEGEIGRLLEAKDPGLPVLDVEAGRPEPQLTPKYCSLL